MPSTASRGRPASAIALPTASAPRARVVRPDARLYSVSPTPTMQYRSRSRRIASDSVTEGAGGGLDAPRPGEGARRRVAQEEVEVLRGQHGRDEDVVGPLRVERSGDLDAVGGDDHPGPRRQRAD